MAGAADQGCLTRHAERRLAGRAIPLFVLDWLLDYGSRSNAGRGAEMICFDKRSRSAIAREIGPKAYARFESKLLKTYAITAADGSVVTVGHRIRRRRSH